MLSADSLRLPSACPSDLPSAAFPSSLLRRLPLPAFTRSITLPHALAYNRLYLLHSGDSALRSKDPDPPLLRISSTHCFRLSHPTEPDLYETLGHETQVAVVATCVVS